MDLTRRDAFSRRRLLKASLATASAAAVPSCFLARFRGTTPPPLPTDLAQATPWPEANAILAATTVPVFPAAKFPVSDFGARGDGRHDDSAAFHEAIAACRRAGGGHVIVPAGAWLVGALRLHGGVDLHLERGATLLFSDDAALYPPVLTRYEGLECVNRSPMIYAYGEDNVALTGEGTLDASRTAAWNEGSDREGVLEPLVARAVAPEKRVVVGQLRSSFVQTHRCRNVLVQGVTLTGAQFWQIHPILCANVTVDGVTTQVSGPNSDGCDPESCDHVVIRGSTLASGDDNIAIKSGRDEDGRRLAVPCQNIVVMNCQAEGRFGFIACGSEQSGGIRNVYAWNNRSYGQGVANVLWVKSNTRRGGSTSNVHVDGFSGAGLRGAVVLVTMDYDGQEGRFRPAFGELHLRNLVIDRAPIVLDIKGGVASPNGPVTLSRSRFTHIGRRENQVLNASGVELREVVINGEAV